MKACKLQQIKPVFFIFLLLIAVDVNNNETYFRAVKYSGEPLLLTGQNKRTQGRV